MTRLLIFLFFLSVFLLALPQLGDSATVVPDVGYRAEEGTIAVFLTPDLAAHRKEVYLGEKLWLVVQIRTAYSPCPFSVEITDLETGEVVLRKSATLNVCGGQMLSGMYQTFIFQDFRIVEPVVEGRRFKIVVRAGDEWGAYTFTERHNPPGRITGITFFEGAKVATVLRRDGQYRLEVKVRNDGELEAGYNLTLLVDGRRFASQRISLRPKLESTAVFDVKLEGLRGRVNFTVVLSGVIVNDVQSVFYDVVSPYPDFSLVYPSSVEGKVGEPLRVGVRLRNEGPTCRQPAVSIKAEPAADVEASYGRSDVGYGGFLDLDLSIRPLSAGRGRLSISVTCINYTSTVYVNYTALAKLSLSAVDQTGGSPPARLSLDGKEVTGEVWLAGGSHVVDAPPEVRVGDARWVFEKWSDGVTSYTRRVDLTGNLEVKALYRLQYYVYFKTPWRTVEGWFDRGAEVEIPSADVEQGDWRYRFKGWSGSGCPASGRFTVLGPARCEAVYVKEYRVVVKLFNNTETYWVEEGTAFRKEVWAESREGMRLIPTGAENCEWTPAQDRIVLSASGPAQCVVTWRREYSVRIESGLGERPLFWEGWLPEGSVIRYMEGGSLLPSKDGLAATTVEESGVRYKPAGWTCNGAEAPREFVVNAPLRCAGLWRKEVQVAVEVYLDGSFKERREFWVAQGDILKLSPSMLMPQAGLLTPLKFAGWEGASGASGDDILLRPETPTTVRAKFYTDHMPLYAVVGAAAVAVALGIFFYIKRKGDHTRIWAKQPTETKEEIEIEPMEDTKTKKEEENN
jgi:hypothetical protein